MLNGRCRMHGGTVGGSHGAPPGNANARKHGIFGKLLTDELVEDAEELGRVEPAERARLHKLAREVRVLRAAGDPATPIAALDRGWSSVIAALDGNDGSGGGGIMIVLGDGGDDDPS